MRHLKEKIFIFSQELFKYSINIYLVLLIIEQLQKGFVSYFFNQTTTISLVLISGFIMVLTYTKLPDDDPVKIISINEIINIIFFSSIGSSLIYYKMIDLGVFAYITSGMTFIIISFISYLVLYDKEDSLNSEH